MRWKPESPQKPTAEQPGSKNLPAEDRENVKVDDTCQKQEGLEGLMCVC